VQGIRPSHFRFFTRHASHVFVLTLFAESLRLIMEYIQEELVNIRRHMRAQDITLDDSDTLSLLRLDAALQAWAKDRKQAEITR
jgi:hypothetical protein